MASNPQHQELLRKYAEAIVKVGLNLRAGQRLIITNAVARGVPPAGRPLVHEVTKAAYAAGAFCKRMRSISSSPQITSTNRAPAA